MLNIFIVNGLPTAGKTTFEKFVQEITGESYTYIMSTVDKVKEFAKLMGWNGEKTPKDRKFLSDLKDILTEWRDIPVRDIKLRLSSIDFRFRQFDVDTSLGCVFIDCREPEEIARLCKELNAKSLFVRREAARSQEILNHADAQVFGYDYDIIIDNNGDMNDLREAAIKFVKDNKLFYLSTKMKKTTT